MIISSHFVKFCNLSLPLLHYSKIYNRIVESFKIRKFWTHNAKVMAKDKKVKISVTYNLQNGTTGL
jgi:hypothetical protein